MSFRARTRLGTALAAMLLLTLPAAAHASHSAYTYLQSWGYHPGGHNLTTIAPITLEQRVEAARIDRDIHYQGWQPDPWGTQLYSDGYARGYADLATGKVGTYASGNDFAQTRAMAGWQENLVFAIPGATDDTYTPITVKVRFDGELFRAAKPGGYREGNASSRFSMFFGQGGYVDSRQTSTSISMQTTSEGAQVFGGGYYWDDFNYVADGTSVLMTGIYRLRGAAPRVSISMNVDSQALGGAFADFLHTAAFDMILPGSVSYRSASGTFLSQVSAVPEPATWALMLGGFGAIGGALRFARRPRGGAGRSHLNPTHAAA